MLIHCTVTEQTRYPLPFSLPGRPRLNRKIDTQDFHRATRDTPRAVNRRILLALLRDRGPTSRAELARSMDLPRGTVTTLVNELLEDGLVQEGPTERSPRGRHPVLLQLRSHDRFAVAVDIRTRKTVVEISDFSGAEVAREEFPTLGSPEEQMDALAQRVESLLARAGVGGCEGVGVVVPGMVHGETGRVLDAGTLGWRDVDLRRGLADRLGLPVHVERDAVACALARMWLERNPGERNTDFVYLIVDEGVGVGLIVNGAPVRGRHYTAGEFGHIPLDPSGPPCSRGGRGCLEAFTSDSATVRRYVGGKVAEDTKQEGVEPSLTVAEIARRALGGEDRAREVLETTGQYLGMGIASIINSLNPARIVLGGSVTEAWELVEPALRTAVAEHTLTAEAADTPITLDGCYPDTRLRGAVALVVAPAFAAPEVG